MSEPYLPYGQPRPHASPGPHGSDESSATQVYDRSAARVHDHSATQVHGRPAAQVHGRSAAQGELMLAPIARRMGARLIDGGLLGVAGFALILPFMIAAAGLGRPGSDVKDGGGVWSGTAVFGWILVLAVLPFAYEAVQLAFWGQTLGKRILHLRVLSAQGEPMPPAQAIGRAAANNIGYLFGCGVGSLMAYLWAIWDQPLHQALHDRIAGTVVVDDREYEAE